MRSIITGGAVLALSFLVMVGCSTPAEPAPAGYHYEMVDIGKERKAQALVPDPNPAQERRAGTIMVRTNSTVQGSGDYWIYATEGKQVTRVLVHDEEVKSGAWLIHISPDQVCPSCKEAYVTVGKHVERRYYCYSNVHVPPANPTPNN
jgi:hypothetical protein